MTLHFVGWQAGEKLSPQFSPILIHPVRSTLGCRFAVNHGKISCAKTCSAKTRLVIKNPLPFGSAGFARLSRFDFCRDCTSRDSISCYNLILRRVSHRKTPLTAAGRCRRPGKSMNRTNKMNRMSARPERHQRWMNAKRRKLRAKKAKNFHYRNKSDVRIGDLRFEARELLLKHFKEEKLKKTFIRFILLTFFKNCLKLNNTYQKTNRNIVFG